MPKENNSNKLITIVLVLVISIAAITLLYVNLPNEKSKETSSGGNQQTSEVLLQITYKDEYFNYTLGELEELESFNGSGGYINSVNVTTGPYELTGVKMSTLLNQVGITSENYSIKVEAIDGYNKTFNLSYINGDIPVYNETGEQIGTGGVTMIINYKSGGEYLDNSTGPLRLAYVYDNGFTSSKIWIKSVVSIEIMDV